MKIGSCILARSYLFLFIVFQVSFDTFDFFEKKGRDALFPQLMSREIEIDS